MEYVRIEAIGQVSRICIGCEQLGGVDWGDVDQKAIADSIYRSIDFGVNFFDTAGVYGLGESERLLAKALGSRRKEVVIATKGGLSYQEGGASGRAAVFRDSRPAAIRRDVHNSMRRLKLERLPVFYVHWPDPRVSVEETVAELERLREQGKIGAIGLSNFDLPEIEKARSIAPIDCVQLPLSLIERSAEPVVEECARLGLAVCCYGALSQGLLSGKYKSTSDFPETDRRHRLPQFGAKAIEEVLPLVNRLAEVADRLGRSMPQTAIRALLDQTPVSGTIVGIKSWRQLEDALGTQGWTLSNEDYDYIVQGRLGIREAT